MRIVPAFANGQRPGVVLYLPSVSHVFSRGREILHRVLQLHIVDTNLSHGMEDYVWDGHRCSFAGEV